MALRIKWLFITVFLAVLIGCGASPEQELEKGFLLFETNQKREAYPHLKKAYRGGIEHPELYVSLAFCCVAIDDNPSAAIELLHEGIQIFPDYAPIYDELGLIAHQFGPTDDGKNLRQAVYFAMKAVELDPDDWKYIDNLGSYLYLEGKIDSALICFRKASELNSANEDIKRRIMQIEKNRLK